LHIRKRSMIICAAVIAVAVVASAQTITVEAAGPAQRNLIQVALGQQYPITKIAAVKSSKHSSAYYIGAMFRVAGVGDVQGVWLVGGTKEQPGTLLSINEPAHRYSGMRLAKETKAAASMEDPEAKALLIALDR